MTVRERRLTRLAQPQDFARVDRGKVSQYGICGGFIVGGEFEPPALPDIVTGEPTFGSFDESIVRWSPVATERGLAAKYFEATGTGRYVRQKTGSPSARSFTWAARVRVNTGTIVGRSGSTGTGTTILLWRSGTAWDLRVNNTDYTAAGTLNFGQWYDIEVVATASSCVLYVDGVVTVSGGAPASGTLDADYAWGDNSGSGNDNGCVEFAYSVFANRPWTDAERAAFRANPWQLFEPRRILVPVSVGGGTPVLSLPGVTGITATGATPKVTVTFS